MSIPKFAYFIFGKFIGYLVKLVLNIDSVPATPVSEVFVWVIPVTVIVDPFPHLYRHFSTLCFEREKI